MATIKDVSELAGVSQATVSRVINGNKKVIESNRQRVLDAMETLGYKPNAFAQALATNRSFSAGMVVGSLAGPFYGPMMHNVEHIMREGGQHLIVTSGQESHDEELEAIRFLLSRRCDVLILHSDAMTDDEILELYQQSDTPIVLVNRYIPDIAESCVYLDNEMGGYLATKHLLEMGHRDIACITGQLSKSDSRARLQGYRNALKTYGIAYNEELVIEGHYAEGGGIEATETLLERGCNFSAVFCCNDYIALSVFDVLTEAGITVPSQVSVIGFDDSLFTRYLTPKLTTIHFPIEELGIQAGRLALQKIQKKPVSVNHRLEPSLIERESVTRKS